MIRALSSLAVTEAGLLMYLALEKGTATQVQQ